MTNKKLSYPKNQSELVVKTVDKLKENDSSLNSIMQNVDKFITDPNNKTKSGSISVDKLSELRQQMFGDKQQDNTNPVAVNNSKLSNGSVKSDNKSTLSDLSSKKSNLKSMGNPPTGNPLSLNEISADRLGFNHVFDPKSTEVFVSSTPKSTRSNTLSLTSRDNSKAKTTRPEPYKKQSKPKKTGPISVKTLEFGVSDLKNKRFNEPLKKNRPKSNQKLGKSPVGSDQKTGKNVNMCNTPKTDPTSKKIQTFTSVGKTNLNSQESVQKLKNLSAVQQPAFKQDDKVDHKIPIQRADQHDVQHENPALETFFSSSASLSLPVKQQPSGQESENKIELDENEDDNIDTKNVWNLEEKAVGVANDIEKQDPIEIKVYEKKSVGLRDSTEITLHRNDACMSQKPDDKGELNVSENQKLEPLKQDEEFFQKKCPQPRKSILKFDDGVLRQSRKRVIFFEDPKYGFYREEIPDWVTEYRPDTDAWPFEAIKSSYSNDCIRSSLRSKPWHDSLTWRGYHADHGGFFKKTMGTFSPDAGSKPVRTIGIHTIQRSTTINKTRIAINQ
jgi:hypothetical protein